MGWSEDGSAGQYEALETLTCRHTQKEKEKRGAGQHKNTTGTMERSYSYDVLLINCGYS